MKRGLILTGAGDKVLIISINIFHWFVIVDERICYNESYYMKLYKSFTFVGFCQGISVKY